jgi:hypothetical protein
VGLAAAAPAGADVAADGVVGLADAVPATAAADVAADGVVGLTEAVEAADVAADGVVGFDAGDCAVTVVLTGRRAVPAVGVPAAGADGDRVLDVTLAAPPGGEVAELGRTDPPAAGEGALAVADEDTGRLPPGVVEETGRLVPVAGDCLGEAFVGVVATLLDGRLEVEVGAVAFPWLTGPCFVPGAGLGALAPGDAGAFTPRARLFLFAISSVTRRRYSSSSISFSSGPESTSSSPVSL